MVKQDPVELESVMSKFNLKDSRVPIDPMLEDTRCIYLSSACNTAFITVELFLKVTGMSSTPKTSTHIRIASFSKIAEDENFNS